ncbi:hypothetical protein B5F08_12765 [Anaeromassilibacillus sp. An172]|uniref:phosphoribosyltransferase family protein n=1 Tax=Anaeromassilibacillus sp. An172 TaxID=1965570 RepID=UPI000B397D74|nr:phosphoribosyltransferase family protein [Anaeromassilibacillus sp. An172]OUP73516.1 hypothetical protein B5F08_12765 [Anaeromassilibacillus sp. An172]
MKRYIKSGVQIVGNDFVFDFEHNSKDDIIEIQTPQIFKSSINNNLYWFGYIFKPHVSSRDRTKFIHYLKGLSEPSISDADLKRFIQRPLQYLSPEVNLANLDCFVYPLSGRSKLVNTMIRVINQFTGHDTNRVNFEMIKSAPTDVQFDWKLFNSEWDTPETKLQYMQMKKYIEDILIPKIHQQNYFSIAKNVKAKYRPYIKNYLKFASTEESDNFSNLSNANILVIDDINASGSTLNEVLRILNSRNNRCNIYVYTLIEHTS